MGSRQILSISFLANWCWKNWCLQSPDTSFLCRFCVGSGSLSSEYILGFCFVTFPPIRPRPESFQWKQSVLQSHAWVNWEYCPYPSIGSTSLCKGLLAESRYLGFPGSRRARASPRELLCSPPWIEVGAKFSSRATVALRLCESLRGCLSSSFFSLSLQPWGGQEF